MGTKEILLIAGQCSSRAGYGLENYAGGQGSDLILEINELSRCCKLLQSEKRGKTECEQIILEEKRLELAILCGELKKPLRSKQTKDWPKCSDIPLF